VNAETTGYKKDTLATSVFTEVMQNRINDPSVSLYGASEVGNYHYGTRVDEQYTDFSEGSLEQTDRQTDLAIAGDGFFVVETADGERYTRAGNFTVDGEGYLVTEDGQYVLSETGRIHTGTSDFAVSEDGTITVNGETVDTLRLETVEDRNVLRKQGDNLYYIYGGAAPVDATNVRVLQGMQESSNASTFRMKWSICSPIYRKYEANQKIVSMTDDSLGLAVNLGKLGKLKDPGFILIKKGMEICGHSYGGYRAEKPTDKPGHHSQQHSQFEFQSGIKLPGRILKDGLYSLRTAPVSGSEASNLLTGKRRPSGRHPDGFFQRIACPNGEPSGLCHSGERFFHRLRTQTDRDTTPRTAASVNRARE
jgi:flagellar basal-body rod protein FlgG